jgi:hypothetical protein
MKTFLVTKIITAELEVRCKNEGEARAWADKIVAGLEDGNGNAIAPSPMFDFEADSNPAELRVEEVVD